MSALAEAPLADPVAVVRTVDGMAAIREPGRMAAVVARRVPPGPLAWLAALDPAQLPRARTVLRPEAVRPQVPSILAAAMPAGPERDWLAADIADLAERFASLMSARWLRLRLDPVTTNACRRFHVDAITARLVCTYRGAGTQYRDPAEGMPLHQVATGAPILLRGTHWIDGDAPRLLHRSPPIEGTGETRLLLVLDPLDDPEDA